MISIVTWHGFSCPSAFLLFKETWCFLDPQFGCCLLSWEYCYCTFLPRHHHNCVCLIILSLFLYESCRFYLSIVQVRVDLYLYFGYEQFQPLLVKWTKFLSLSIWKNKTYIIAWMLSPRKTAAMFYFGPGDQGSIPSLCITLCFLRYRIRIVTFN